MGNKIYVKDIGVSIHSENNMADFICITDIAKYKDAENPRFIIQNWMRTRNTVEFLGVWESLYNTSFNRVEFEAVRQQAGLNSFVLTPQKWIERTNAIGITSKAGRYGGTYAHKDIAFEFASWVSVEFKLYLIKEFERLKALESHNSEWNIRRLLSKINYGIHTDAVKNVLIPTKLSQEHTKFVYANEADVLNVALFGMTANQWRKQNPDKPGNIRDYANMAQLVCLINLESLNSVYISQGKDRSERLQLLNDTAIYQMQLLLEDNRIIRLSESQNTLL